MKKYEQLKISADIENLAIGLKRMFTEEEIAILQCGMLPALKIRLFEDTLRVKLMETTGAESSDSTKFKLIPVDSTDLFEEIEFTVDELVSEITRDVTLKIYSITKMVV